MDSSREKAKDLENDVETITSKLETKIVVDLDHVDWEDAGKDLQWAVLLKLASGKPFPKSKMVAVLDKVWKLTGHASYHKVERNLLLVNFSSKEDQEKVLSGGPWTLEGSAILIQKWETGMNEDDFVNTTISIWVHIHRLPFELRKTEFAKNLAVYAGRIHDEPTVRKHGKTESSQRGMYTRNRIDLDTTRPILPGLFLKRPNRKPTWISMKYERLPNTCFRCGRLDHETRQCKTPINGNENVYGGWLKAEDQSEFIPEWSDELPETRHLIVDPAEVQAPQASRQVEVEETPSISPPPNPIPMHYETLDSVQIPFHLKNSNSINIGYDKVLGKEKSTKIDSTSGASKQTGLTQMKKPVQTKATQSEIVSPVMKTTAHSKNKRPRSEPSEPQKMGSKKAKSATNDTSALRETKLTGNATDIFSAYTLSNEATTPDNASNELLNEVDVQGYIEWAEVEERPRLQQ